MSKLKLHFSLLCLLSFLLTGAVTGLLANEKRIDKRELEFVEDSKDEIPINNKFRSGLNLVYDCYGRYFACVDKDSAQYCADQYATNKKLKLSSKHECISLKKFATRVDCLKEQYRLLQEGGNLSFCRNTGKKTE